MENLHGRKKITWTKAKDRRAKEEEKSKEMDKKHQRNNE